MLGDPTRLGIVAYLARNEGRPLNCGQFLELGSKTNLSYHLAKLREAGVTRTEAIGTSRLITLRRDDLDRRFPGLLDSILASARTCRSVRTGLTGPLPCCNCVGILPAGVAIMEPSMCNLSRGQGLGEITHDIVISIVRRGVCPPAGIAVTSASAQSVSGNEGSGEAPRSLDNLPDLSQRKIVERGPKVDDISQRSFKQPTEEDMLRLHHGHPLQGRQPEERRAGRRDQDLHHQVAEGVKETRAAPKTGPDPLYEEAERTIIGEDNRIRINDTTSYPFRTFGQLWSVDKNGGWSTCSATLISIRAVLTAAHCLYDHGTGGWLTDYEFIRR